MPLEQRLDELRDELAEVRMQAVDVLRPLPLGEVGLGPREVEVDAPVERVLGRGHGLARFDKALERLPEALQPAVAHGDDVEAGFEAGRVGMCRKPGLGRSAQTALLLAVTISSGSPRPDRSFAFTSTNARPATASDD
jgi:hypothetical protein